MGIDRQKYMSAEEVKVLRAVTEHKSMNDLKRGRVTGVISWMLVDMALVTGLRAAELATIKIEDVDLKRGALRIVRAKKKKKVKETLAIGKNLVAGRCRRVSDCLVDLPAEHGTVYVSPL